MDQYPPGPKDGCPSKSDETTMANRDRGTRRPSLGLETLERKNLLSISGLIAAAPTLNIQLDPPHVTKFPHGNGEISILQPAIINVYGTAQPQAPNSIVRVLIFAEDAGGNLVNNGQPLNTFTPDVLGRYSGQISLPSNTRKDVNYLVAYEEALGRFSSDITIKPTTLSGLTGNVALNGTSLTGLTGSLTLNDTTINGLNGTITTGPTTVSGLTATTVNGGAITQSGSATVAGTTGTLAQNGLATLTGGTGTDTQTGAAAVGATSGVFAQSGTAVIAGTTATSTMVSPDVAVSQAITIHVHQPARHAALTAAHAHGRTHAAAHPAVVHATSHPQVVVLVERVGGRR